MKPENAKTRDRAEMQGHHKEFWSRRPLATWVKSAANKLLARRLERHRSKQSMKGECRTCGGDCGQC